MITKIKDFWIKSYTSDKVAFYFEMASFVFTVAASLTLAVNADQPDMRYVYPGFFIGSVTAVYAYIRRQMAWPLVLASYFAVVNVLGFSVAMGWN